MAEEIDQTLPLPDEYPEPCEDVVNGDEEEENNKDQSVKCSPNLLQMLKAAESRRTPQSWDRDREEASGTEETEAQKTDMVRSSFTGLLDMSIYMVPVLNP
ncbi:hypothetical protein CgunFtcFv8_013286 [Champsocephalus gunnari]|uniref:Uncharacterized protein n=1 Tax=Champsocephalus gunnari TaxID=52237 RepID=A0AAN8HUP1_CHAGU|nr:hypothetical protein CgunFtcFv8_013286 [Champsocephalus gunnari]